MARRIASNADERHTSNSTSDKRKKRISLRISTRLCVFRAGARKRWLFDGNGFASIDLGRKRFVFARWLGYCGAHEINPHGEGSQSAGFILSQRLFLVEANPYAAGDAGRESNKPRIGIFVGSAGFTRQRMIELERGAGGTLVYNTL